MGCLKKLKSREDNSVFGKRAGGLKRRWFGKSVTAVLIGILLVAILASLLLAVYYYSSMRSGLESMADAASSFVENYLSEDYAEFFSSCELLTEEFEERDRIELQFIDRNGILIASSASQWSGYRVDAEDLSAAMSVGKKASYLGKSSLTGKRILAVSVPLHYGESEIIGVLRYSTGLSKADRQVGTLILAVFAFSLAAALLVVIGSSYFLRSIVDQIAEITKTAKRIAAGSHGSYISKITDDEIGALSESINEMSDAISRTEQLQSEFISSVSHELRTPLTAISGWGQTLLESPDVSKEEFTHGMTIMLNEAKRLTGMVEELLDFTRIQDGRMVLTVSPCDLRAGMEDTIFMYAARLKGEGMELEYLDNDDDIPEIPCDLSRLRQVFFNLLDNAVKHGGSGKKITAGIFRVGNEISIQVRDFGPGIPEEELPYIKNKFYKGSSKAHGNGIGLAVCDEIVRLHNGTLTLSNAEGGGTLADVRIPIPDETIGENL